jgi:4-amino-4-deoxy-L-arabinose transferase-like glycosyltransferase
MLAVPAHFGIDPTVSAKWIDGFFLSCSIFLMGFIAWANCRRSYAVGVLAALAIALSPDIIEIHSQVLSEAPFIAFVLAGIAMLLSYANSGKKRYLIGLSIAFSAALLTRYAGVFFLIAVCVVVALNWQNLKQRSVSLIGVASAVAVWPLGFWIIRNMLVNGSGVGHRKFVFHPQAWEQFLDLCRTVSRWFAPSVPRSLGALLLLAIVTAIAVIFASLFRSRRRSAEMAWGRRKCADPDYGMPNNQSTGLVCARKQSHRQWRLPGDCEPTSHHRPSWFLHQR